MLRSWATPDPAPSRQRHPFPLSNDSSVDLREAGRLRRSRRRPVLPSAAQILAYNEAASLAKGAGSGAAADAQELPPPGCSIVNRSAWRAPPGMKKEAGPFSGAEASVEERGHRQSARRGGLRPMPAGPEMTTAAGAVEKPPRQQAPTPNTGSRSKSRSGSRSELEHAEMARDGAAAGTGGGEGRRQPSSPSPTRASGSKGACEALTTTPGDTRTPPSLGAPASCDHDVSAGSFPVLGDARASSWERGVRDVLAGWSRPTAVPNKRASLLVRAFQSHGPDGVPGRGPTPSPGSKPEGPFYRLRGRTDVEGVDVLLGGSRPGSARTAGRAPRGRGRKVVMDASEVSVDHPLPAQKVAELAADSTLHQVCVAPWMCRPLDADSRWVSVDG